MLAAIYARKSTDQEGIRDEDKSVARQIEHAKAYAAKKGWTVVDDYLFSDDGISGAEFLRRPGLLRLLNALKPKPLFQVLIMSEESRLGREQIETAYVLKQIIDAGVRVFFYLEDRERMLLSATDKVMLALTNFASEMEREKASQRTRDAMLRKARMGHAVGGRIFGYDNVDVTEPGPDGKPRRLYVTRRINQHQAAIVLKIFEMFAEGHGLARIAKSFNADHIPAPRSGGMGWCPSAVREILRREIYKGVIVYNRTASVQQNGTIRQRKRPPNEWLRTDAPDLRIVPEDLWQRVHARLQAGAEQWPRGENGRLRGHVGGHHVKSQYLLSGLAQCGVCGGSLVVETRISKKGRYVQKLYACAYHHKRGASVCTNGTTVGVDLLDAAVLRAVKGVLNERIIETTLDRALAQIRDGQSQLPDRRSALERELSLIDTRLRNLVESVARSGGSEALLSAVKQEEARRQALARELSGVDQQGTVASLDAGRLAKAALEAVGDVTGLLKRRMPQGRRVLQAILNGRLKCYPFEENGRRGYRFQGTGTLARVLGRGISHDGGGGQGI